MTKEKVILVIGTTGVGKSTLINTLADKRATKTGDSLIGVTKNIQTVKFSNNEVDYKIIDTVGFADLSMNTIECLKNLANISREIDGKINQIFYVFDGRLQKPQIELYFLLRKILFDMEDYKHTTLIRTKYYDYEKAEKCQEDYKNLINEAKKSVRSQEWIIEEARDLPNMLENCNGIVFVDNPPYHGNLGAEIDKTIARGKVINHLEENCNTTYKINIENLNSIISKHEKTVRNLNETISQLVKEKTEIERDLKLTQEEKDKALQEIEKQKEILADKVAQFEVEKQEFEFFRSISDTEKELWGREAKSKELIIDGIRAENKVLRDKISKLEWELKFRNEQREKFSGIINNYQQRAEEEKQRAKQFQAQVRELQWEQKSPIERIVSQASRFYPNK